MFKNEFFNNYCTLSEEKTCFNDYKNKAGKIC